MHPGVIFTNSYGELIVKRLRRRLLADPNSPFVPPLGHLIQLLTVDGVIRAETDDVLCPFALADGDRRWLVILPKATYHQPAVLYACLRVIGQAQLDASSAPPTPIYMPHKWEPVDIEGVRESFHAPELLADEFALAWILPSGLMLSGLTDEAISKQSGCSPELVSRRWKMLCGTTLVRDTEFVSRTLARTRLIARRKSTPSTWVEEFAKAWPVLLGLLGVTAAALLCMALVFFWVTPAKNVPQWVIVSRLLTGVLGICLSVSRLHHSLREKVYSVLYHPLYIPIRVHSKLTRFEMFSMALAFTVGMSLVVSSIDLLTNGPIDLVAAGQFYKDYKRDHQVPSRTPSQD